MSGIDLMEMEASNMMDVLHFLFEEDFTSVSEEHARSRSAIRDTLYNEMYGVKYSFKLSDPKNRSTSASNSFDYSEYESMSASEPVDLRKEEPFSPRDNSKKIKFIDSSDMPLVTQSFEGLDAPLN